MAELAQLAGFITRRPLSGERFHLLNPTDCTTPQDARDKVLVMKGYSPELKANVKTYVDLSLEDGR